MEIVPQKLSKAKSLDLPAISPRNWQPRMSLSVFADIMTMKKRLENLTEFPIHAKETTRGNITTFTNKSRNRFLRTAAKIRNPGKMKFVTLTYPDELWFDREPHLRKAWDNLDSLCKRVERKYPAVGIIWRPEWKPRVSGVHRGEIAPHFHLIVKSFTMSKEAAQRWFLKAWAEVIGLPHNFKKPLQVHVRVADNRRHALSYMSKYTAKVNTKDELLISEFFHKHSGELGRHWGIRGNWDLSESVTIDLSVSEAVQLKRIIRSWLKSKDEYRAKYGKRLSKIKETHGFSVFGLGDGEKPPRNSLIMRMCSAAIALDK